MDEENKNTDHTAALDTEARKPEEAHRNLVAQVLGIGPKLDDEEKPKEDELTKPEEEKTSEKVNDGDTEQDTEQDTTQVDSDKGPESDGNKPDNKPAVKVKKAPKKDPFTPDPVQGGTVPKVEDKQPQKPAKEPEKPKEDKNIGFSEEERAELEIWEYGEEHGHAQKGITDQMRKFFKDRKAKLEKLAEDNHDEPDYDPKSDRSYQRWLSTNRPNVTAQQRAKIEREQLIAAAEERTEKRVSERLEKKIKELESRQYQSEVKPAVERQVKEYQAQLMEAVPEEVMAHWKESQDFDKTTEEFPIEAPVAAEEIKRTTAVAQEYLAIRKGLKAFNGTDESHKFIFKFVDDQANIFLKKGGDKLVRGGKTFVHPYKYDPADGTTWTFDDGQVLSMLGNYTKQRVQTRIKEERDRVKKYAKYYDVDPKAGDKTKKDSQNGTGGQGGDDPNKQGKPSTSVKPGMGGGAAKASKQAEANPVAEVLGFGRR